MNIVYITPECSPFTKATELSDIVNSLSKGVEKEGHNVYIFMPRYGCIEPSYFQIERIPQEFKVRANDSFITTMVYKGILAKSLVSVFFIESQNHFSNSKEICLAEPQDEERFKFFAFACLEIVSKLKIKPDVIHLFSPQTAYAAKVLRSKNFEYAHLSKIGIVFTIEFLDNLQKKLIELTKEAVQNSDFISTVSKTYAHELLSDIHDLGLSDLLISKRDRFTGILINPDNDEYDPESDTSISQTYSKNYFTLGKRKCKEDLLDLLGLQKTLQVPLFGVALNHTDKDTIETLVTNLPLISHQNLELVILCSIKDSHCQELNKAISKYKNIRVCTGYDLDHNFSKKFFAALDFFLTLNKYEPSGMAVLIAMKFGALPIAYSTGGIKEIIIDIDNNKEEANGIIFKNFSREEISEAISKAIKYYKSKEAWPKLVKQTMSFGLSNSSAAKQYIKHYEQIVHTANVC